MSELLGALVVGLGTGAGYAVVALGFVVVFRAMGVISFAQPAFLLTGAVTVSALAPVLGFLAACLAGVAATGLLAYGAARVVLRPLLGRPVVAVVVVTIALDVVVRVVVVAVAGGEPRTLGDPWGLDVSRLGGVVVQHRHVVALVVGVAVVGLLASYLSRSRSGLAARAVNLDREAAMAQGIDVLAVQARSWGVGGALAALGGVLLALGTAFDPSLWTLALVALPVIVLGGLDSPVGALVAGLLLGVVEAVVATYESRWFPGIETSFAVVVPYVLMVLVLIARPRGLWGRAVVERV